MCSSGFDHTSCGCRRDARCAQVGSRVRILSATRRRRQADEVPMRRQIFSIEATRHGTVHGLRGQSAAFGETTTQPSPRIGPRAGASSRRRVRLRRAARVRRGRSAIDREGGACPRARSVCRGRYVSVCWAGAMTAVSALTRQRRSGRSRLTRGRRARSRCCSSPRARGGRASNWNTAISSATARAENSFATQNGRRYACETSRVKSRRCSLSGRFPPPL
jgi:hypothetical protein